MIQEYWELAPNNFDGSNSVLLVRAGIPERVAMMISLSIVAWPLLKG